MDKKIRKVGRPKKKEQDKLSEIINVRVSFERKQIIGHHARINQKSQSEIVNLALDQYFERKNERLDNIRVH